MPKLLDRIISSYEALHPNKSHSFQGSVIQFDGSQIMDEFSTAWYMILNRYCSNPPEQLSFLEVGAYRGLWGIAFTELCMELGIKGKYVTITLLDDDPANQHLIRTLSWMEDKGIDVELIDMDTRAVLARQEVEYRMRDGGYNMVFIDAGHKYEDVLNDIGKFHDMAKDMLIFHDIRPKERTPEIGVYAALTDYGLSLSHEVSVNPNLMGIGFIVKPTSI